MSVCACVFELVRPEGDNICSKESVEYFLAILLFKKGAAVAYLSFITQDEITELALIWYPSQFTSTSRKRNICAHIIQ